MNKCLLRKSGLIALCAGGFLMPSAGLTQATAQVVESTQTTTTTTTTNAGIISEVGPELIVLRSEGSPSPVRYVTRKTTTYVDETGKPVAVTTVKSGQPVSVTYIKEGDRFVASKVIVRSVTQAGGTPIQGTTTVGTVSEFTPDTIVVRATGSPEPLRYRYSKTTTYVDETGQPVAVETVKSGLPVTVVYTKEGGNLVASRVIVRKTTSVAPDGTTVEQKTTTTY